MLIMTETARQSAYAAADISPEKSGRCQQREAILWGTAESIALSSPGAWVTELQPCMKL